MSANIFVDTNIFVYAHVENDIQKHQIAVSLLRTQLPGEKIIQYPGFE
jgi:predicted nucleic acid-binding protein